jgi:NAD(P)-dependent dehydrogenase (short-subunit alcohol dehydrogenase family)
VTATARDVRVVLVTGCSSGFGRAMVPAFLERGWRVLATLRGPDERGPALAAEGERHPGRLLVVSLDVTRDDERRATVAAARARWGRLDCVVNNAGRALWGALEEVTPGELRAQMEVNFLGGALLVREALPLLRASGGRVILISSIFGRAGFPLSSAYCASKFALEGFGAAVREELRPHGVQVAVVEPGRHRTGFIGRAAWGEESGSARSPYRAQSTAFAELSRRLADSPGPPAARVAAAVVALAGRRRMPARVRVGRDAQLAHLVSRCLPERLAGAVWALACARALRPRAERDVPAEATP